MRQERTVRSLIDLTNLDKDLNPLKLRELIHKSNSGYASICVALEQVKEARALTASPIAAVINFPNGNQPLKEVQKQIVLAEQAGATEIDVVVPYELYYKGERTEFLRFMHSVCRLAHPTMLVKAIVESSHAPSLNDLREMCLDLLYLGVDFLKTSTGVNGQATSAGVDTLIGALVSFRENTGKAKGLKISGGLNNLNQVHVYLDKVTAKLGDGYVSPLTLRIGSSKL